MFPDLITRGVEPPPKPSNISKRVEYKLGDVEAGFAAADEIVEMSFKTAPVHQAYIEPQGCVARCDADGQGKVWSSSQGHLSSAPNGAASCNAFASSQAQGGQTGGDSMNGTQNGSVAIEAQGGQTGGDSMNGTQNGSVAIAPAAVTLFFCFVVGLSVTK